MNADIKKEISIKEELAGKDDNITQESENVSAVKQEPRFIASKMNEGSGEIAEKNDPYAYLSRNEFSSELFKIEINNLPKYFGVGVRTARKVAVYFSNFLTFKKWIPATEEVHDETRSQLSQNQVERQEFRLRNVQVRGRPPGRYDQTPRCEIQRFKSVCPG